MKKLIRWFCKIIGIETWYLITAVFEDDKGRDGLVTFTVSISPWAHVDNYKLIVDYTQKKSGQEKSRPHIITLTKLGL
jgi:hypothetical protein